MPKIPSVKITDVAHAIAPNLTQETVGLRPGEKIHEVMCPRDDCHLTLEFDDHYIIRPAIQFFDREGDFSVNNIGEVGKPVEAGFEYSSSTNPDFLTVDEIREHITSEGLA